MGKGTPASVGVDVGNFNSKSALTYEDHGVLQLCVVEFIGPYDDPTRPELPNSLNEFTGRGGLDKDGQVVVGRPALKLDVNFSIKSVVLYLSVGNTDSWVMQKAPDGPELLAAVRDHLVNKDQLEEMVREHIVFLWSMINKAVANHELEIIRIGLSHPSFLDEDEGAQHFERYTEYVEKVAREVMGDDYDYYPISEGQATGVYICERFRADVHGMYKHYTQELFKDMDTSKGAPLVIYDGGSSTLSISLQFNTFDGEGRIKNSWSIETPRLKLGLQGGSDIFNSEIKQWLKQQLEPIRRRGQLRPGALAAYLQSVERQKRDINYYANSVGDLDLFLEGRKASHTVEVTVPSEVVQVSMHKAYDEILELIRETNRYILGLGSSFGILYCGGSLTNPGSRSVISEDMAVIKREAKERGLKVTHAHLTDKDGHWSAAVSGGTSLAIHNMPDPVPMLRLSAIGLQRQFRRPDGSIVNSESENQADILFCGGGNLWPSDQSNLEPGTEIPGEIFFSLVCDLEYVSNRDSTAVGYKPIRVNAEEKILTGQYTAHDLGFSVSNTDLPQEKVFTLRSELLQKMTAGGQMADAHLRATEIIAILSCFWITPANKKRYRPEDKKWRLIIQTDPGCKRPMVRRVQELPFWCSRCQQELEGTVRVCKDCPNYALCYLCFLRKDHEPSHTYRGVDLGNHPEIPAFSQPRVRTSAINRATAGPSRRGRRPAQPSSSRTQPVTSTNHGFRGSKATTTRAARAARAAPPPATPRAESGSSSSMDSPIPQRQRRLRVARSATTRPELGSSSRSSRPRPRPVRDSQPPVTPQPEPRGSEQRGGSTTARPTAHTEDPTRQEGSEVLTGRQAWGADFPPPDKPFKIPTHQAGRQSAWEALVYSWRAQRFRLEAENKVKYGDITEEELEDTFNVLLSNRTIAPDDEDDIDLRWAAMAKTFTQSLYRSFRILVQMAYVYSNDGPANFVLVGVLLPRPAMRVWVFNDNNKAANWAESRFYGLGIDLQAGPSQTPASNAPSQRSSEHSGDEVDAEGSSGRGGSMDRDGEESMDRDGEGSMDMEDATHTGLEPSSAVDASSAPNDASSDASSDEVSLLP